MYFYFSGRASGASTFSYWAGNFLFDFLLKIAYMFIFASILTGFDNTVYGGNGWGYTWIAGLFFIVASIFRYYIFSYYVDNIKLAQTIFLYGSLASVFACFAIWFLVVFLVGNGNAAMPLVKTVGYILTLLEPTFGYFLLIVYEKNYFGILSSHPGSYVLSSNMALSSLC